MRKLIMWNVVTLDGYFEGEKNWDLSFHELVWGKELEEFSLTQLKSADMLVFGATTYKGMADYWTKAEGEIVILLSRNCYTTRNYYTIFNSSHICLGVL